MDQISQGDTAPQQNPVSSTSESAAFKLDTSIGAAPSPAPETPISPLPANNNHKKIKLWAGVFGGIVIVVVALVLVFGKTAFYKGRTPSAPALEDAKTSSEETRGAATEEPKEEPEQAAQETTAPVSDTKPVEVALVTPDTEKTIAVSSPSEVATAAKTAEEQAVRESAAAQALASQVENLMQLINQLLEQIKQAIANGDLAEAERLTAQLLQTVQKMQGLAAQAQAQAAEASASAAEASTNIAGAAAAQAQDAAEQAQNATEQAEAAAQEAQTIVAEASDKSAVTEAGEETVAADDFIAQCIAAGGYITDDKQCNVKSVGIYGSLAALQEGLVDYGNCVSVSNYRWLEETQECVKVEYASGTEESKEDKSKDEGLKAPDGSTTDKNAELIQNLLNEIERLRQESQTNQNNSAILARIAELEAALARLGQQAPPPVNVTVTIPTGGAGRARTECADPSFTYDPVREVCVPPTEVIVRPAAGRGRTAQPDEEGAADETPASPDEGTRSGSVSAGTVPPAAQDSTPATTSIGAAGTVSGAAAGTSATGAYGTFIQGGTGPAAVLYPVLIGIANTLWYLARRRKKK